jgi:hypothetical protein
LSLLLLTGSLLLAPGVATAGAATEPERQAPPEAWPFEAGRVEVGLLLGGGPTLQHGTRDANVVAVLPRVGYVVHEFLSGVPGSVEVLAQPSYLAVFEDGAIHVGGLAALAKYNFRTGTAITPYVEVGAGVTYASRDVPSKGSQFNFSLQAGVGVQYALSGRATVNLAWLYHHLSNADLYARNGGLNTGLFLLGISLFY